jgi:hypothetical protein
MKQEFQASVTSNRKRKLLSEEMLCLENGSYSGDKMSLLQATFSYGWMTAVNPWLYTTTIIQLEAKIALWKNISSQDKCLLATNIGWWRWAFGRSCMIIAYNLISKHPIRSQNCFLKKISSQEILADEDEHLVDLTWLSLHTFFKEHHQKYDSKSTWH